MLTSHQREREREEEDGFVRIPSITGSERFFLDEIFIPKKKKKGLNLSPK